MHARSQLILILHIQFIYKVFMTLESKTCHATSPILEHLRSLTPIVFVFFSLLPSVQAETKSYTFNLTKTIEPELSFKLVSADGSGISIMNEINFVHTTDNRSYYPHKLEAKFLEGAKIDSNIIDKQFDIKVERSIPYSVNGSDCSTIDKSCPDQSTLGLVNEPIGSHVLFEHTSGKPQRELKSFKSNVSLTGFVVTHQRSEPFSAGYYSEQWIVTVTPAL